MDGLIPMVYKSLKKNKTRRNYECLSSGVAQAYNISDFYVREDDDRFSTKGGYVIAGPDNVPRTGGPHHHRRYNSVNITGGAARDFALAAEEDDAKPKHQLVRFRSHRMFSCVTGA